MEIAKEVPYDRRATPPPKGECIKIDTFQSISASLTRIESKVDDLNDEMKTMIRLEQQVLAQSEDIDRVEKQIEDLRLENKDLSSRLLELRSNFEMQRQSLSTFERVAWAVATCGAILIGKYLFGIG